MNASEQILQYVEHAWAEAKKSENKDDKNAAEMIEFKSSSTINFASIAADSLRKYS